MGEAGGKLDFEERNWFLPLFLSRIVGISRLEKSWRASLELDGKFKIFLKIIENIPKMCTNYL